MPPRLTTFLAASVAALALGFYLGLPELSREVNTALALVARADITPLRDYLLGFGAWAVVVSALLQFVTSILAPLPSFVLSFTNALVFGFWWGLLLTWTTALAAAAVCFGLARKLGRPVVERFTTRRALAAVDGFFERHGVYAVVIARLIPFMNPDVVSYAAGLTPLRWRVFILSIALASLPSSVVYSYLGARGVTSLGWLLVPLVGLGLVTLALAVWRARRPKRTKPPLLLDSDS
jgi:uncharacterized membrane protein YdjX (TVP38/TMEM64 family)